MINFAQVGNDLYTGKRSIDFIKRQKTWYALSAVLIALALVGIFVKGLNFGIEFSGGSEFRVQGVSNSQGYEEKAQSAISTRASRATSISTVIGQDTVRVQSEAASERTDEASAASPSSSASSKSAVSASLIGPSWGQSVSQQAIRGLIVFLILVDDRHGALLPHVEDGRRRAGRPAARPRHHGRHLRPLRVRDHARRR